MVPAPQAALLVAEIVAKVAKSSPRVAKDAESSPRAVDIRRICVWGRSVVGVNHVAHGKTCELA